MDSSKNLEEKERFEADIRSLVTLHEADKDLQDHKIGRDYECMYCEQYKAKKLEYKKKFGLELRTSNAKTTLKKASSVFEVVLASGREYIVRGVSEADVASKLKVKEESLSRVTIIPEKYHEHFFVEKSAGAVVSLKQLTKSKKQILAKKAPSRATTKRYCYNEKPFNFFHYKKPTHLIELRRFCHPYKVVETKKFKTVGRVTIEAPTGSFSINLHSVVIRLTPTVLVQIKESEFEEIFTIEENLTWNMVE